LSGLVAVIALPGASPVARAELDRLAADYEAVRGRASRRVDVGGDRARAARLSVTGDVAVPTCEPPSWVVVTGTAHPARLWTRSHTQELSDLDGQFAVVSYDASADEVVVAADPLGMHAVYRAHRPGRLYVSTCALALVRHLRCPASRLGVQAFLLSGYQFGTRTNWDDVRRLDPATRIVVGTDDVAEGIYWRPSIDRSVWALPFDRAVDHALEVAQDTFRSHLGADGMRWADLTGGYDSRLMCLLLESAGVKFATNTRSVAGSDDVDIARVIAARRGWDWVNPTLPDDWAAALPAHLGATLGWGDGQLEVLQLARVLWVHEQLAQQRPQLLSAGGGEHLQYYGWQSEFLAAGRSRRPNIDRWIDMIALKPTDESVLAGGPRPAVHADFRERLTRWLEPWADELNTTQLEMAYAYKCTGHFGAYRSADAAHLEAQLPFYFKPVFEAAFSSSYRHRNGHKLMRAMIERLDRQVADIVTTRGGPALPWRPWRAHRFLPYYAVVGRKAVNKLSAKALGRPLMLRHSVFPWQPAANAAVLDALGSDLLSWPSMRIAPLIRRERLDALIARSTTVDFADTPMLGRIITAEMSLRVTDTTLDA
jgi:asparagine synthetase B (glutamine-hydrolysing)